MASHFSATWRLINDEHFQIMSLFKIGMRSFSEASHLQPGAYLTGLLSCALAIERLCKLIIIMDNLALKNTTGSGSGITKKTFKDDIRHDIWKAIAAVSLIAQRRGVTDVFPQRDGKWQSDLLDLLSDVSQGKCRYHAIDTLIGEKADDPLIRLRKIMDQLIQEKGIISAKAMHVATAVGGAIDRITFTLNHDLDGNSLSTQETLLLQLVYPLANRQLRVCLIDAMKPLCEVAMSLNGQSSDFPDGNGHYFWFNNETSYLSKLKKWKR